MSKSVESGAVRVPAAMPSSGQNWQRILSCLAAALFFTRFFLPAESAVQGDTLWLAGLWMVCGLVWTLGIWRRTLPAVRLDWLDAAVGLWIGGQVVSAVAVILTVGEKRAAANLAWEWIALGLMWGILRYGIVEREYRRAILRAVIVTGTLLSGFGLFQHYVSHPQVVAEYGPVFDRLKTAAGAEAAAIKQKLARDGIPTEGPAAILFEKRLRDSREPLALFALANTFGGFLAVCLVLTIGAILTLRRRGHKRRALVPLLLAAAILGWCLLLTKSRTAWIGTTLGIVMLLVPRIRLAVGIRRLVISIGLALAAMIGVAALLAAAGGLDRQVLSEAPKSLSYRIQYWQATGRLIADHPWLGVGSGNFRQHYLRDKSPEASEEIADPHNLFFDVAATGGIFSLGGLLACLGLAFAAGWREIQAESLLADNTSKTGNPAKFGGSQISHFVYWAAGLGAPLAFAGSLGCWGEWDDRLLVLAVIWVGVAWGFNLSWPNFMTSQNRGEATSVAILAAALALAVHLLGAGGISMPGVSQFLILLLAWSAGPFQSATPAATRTRYIGALVAGVATLGCVIGLTVTSLMPVITSRSLMIQGAAKASSANTNAREVAKALYRQAAAADDWSPEPWRHQFELSLAAGIQSNESFEDAVKHLHEVMRRDPANFWGPRSLGQLWYQKSQRTHSGEDAGEAARWLRRAGKLYPTNSEIQAELAFALESAGEKSDALAAVRGALIQDEIYHQQGHVDRYLPSHVSERLQAMTKGAAE